MVILQLEITLDVSGVISSLCAIIKELECTAEVHGTLI